MSNIPNVEEYFAAEADRLRSQNYLHVGQKLYDYVRECRCCGDEFLLPVLDLGRQELANSYRKDLHENQLAFPLQLNVCMNCFHGQLSVVVNPDILFKNYAYVSGTTQTLKEYFNWFAEWTIKQSGKANGRVLDIACNDGSQLDAYKARGWDTYGVDPAENIVPIAQSKGHCVTQEYWGASSDIPGKTRVYDIIVAQNVFAHTHDILGFLKACDKVMHNKTKLYIQTSQANMFLNGEFDTMYHEHLSFFNTLSMYQVVERAGLVLNNVTKTPIHGTSYVFEIGSELDSNSNVPEVINEEQNGGLYNSHMYIRFAKSAKRLVDHVNSYIDGYKKMGYTIAGYGAAAKFMTVLQYGKMDLSFIVDDAPLKQGHYTPGRNIRIMPSEFVAGGLTSTLWIIGAWNFKDEIIKKIKALRPNVADEFLTYFPHVEITK